MGTELHRGVNQLNESLHSQNSNALKTSHYWSQPSKIAAQDRSRIITEQSQVIMNRSQEQLNLDAMRKTMLRQEELFREQVRELHRLYQVQKTLMSELHKNKQNKQKPLPYPAQLRIINPNQELSIRTFRPPPAPMLSPFITIHQPYNQHQSFDAQCEGSSEEPSCSSQRGFDIVSSRANLEEPVRSPWRGDHSEVDNELELTLSIGQQKKSNEKKPIAEEEEESSHPNNSSSDQSNSHKPHWLLQALSLNRT